MGFTQADLKVISTVFDKTVDEISGAASSENEVSLGLRLNGKVVSHEDEVKDRETAIQQGKELRSKEIAKIVGLTLEPGEKDPDIIADKIYKKASSEMEEKYKDQTPDDKIKDYELKLSEAESKYNKLLETHDNTQNEIKEWQEKHDKVISERKEEQINNKILKSFPENMSMDKDDALLIVKNKVDFETTDDGILSKRGGKTIMNAVGKPETIDNVITSIVEEKGWIGKQNGMDGKDRNEGSRGLPGGMSDEEAYKYISEKGEEPMSQKGIEMFNELTSKQ